MSSANDSTRRRFLRTAALATAGLLGSGPLAAGERLMAATARAGLDPGDPEVPNEEVARILRLFGDRPIRQGHVVSTCRSLKVGRWYRSSSSDLPMTAEDFVKSAHDRRLQSRRPLAAFHAGAGHGVLSTRIR
jgi:hypothetical protein